MEPRPAPALRWRAARSEARGAGEERRRDSGEHQGHHLGAWSARRWWSGAGRAARRGGPPGRRYRSAVARQTLRAGHLARLFAALAGSGSAHGRRVLRHGRAAPEEWQLRFHERCAIHEQTLEPALTGILRFLCLQFDDFPPRLQRRGGLAEIVLDEAPGRYGRALSYFTLWMITHGLACWLVGRRIPILAIDLRCPQPDYIEDYRVMFSDNLRFSRPSAACCSMPTAWPCRSAATSGSCGASCSARRPTSWSAIAIRRAWRRGSRPCAACGRDAGRTRTRSPGISSWRPRPCAASCPWKGRATRR